MQHVWPNGKHSVNDIASAVARALGVRVNSCEKISGGMIGDVHRLELDDARVVVTKDLSGPEARLDIEARMLRHSRSAGVIPVPEVLFSSPSLLIQEFMPGSHMSSVADVHAGELLAHLHSVRGDRFGFGGPTLNGSFVLPSPWCDRWIPFFRDHRLGYAADAALANGTLSTHHRARIQLLQDRLEDVLVEPAFPSLLHGDVWSANVLANGPRITAFLDPSVCYGDPELELAYAATFGEFGPPLFDAYESIRPIAAGFWAKRRHVYAVYPAIMHVYYFGNRFVPLLESTLGMTGV